MNLCLFQVMMYPNKAFTRNGRNTITSRKEPYLKFGQREQLSVGDVRAVNKLYKCQHYLQVRPPVSCWVYSSDFYLFYCGVKAYLFLAALGELYNRDMEW